jgi:serine/threonine protein kinase
MRWLSALIRKRLVICGRYRVLDERRGGQAVVYRAKDLKTGEIYAIKKPLSPESPKAVQQFRNEVRLWLQLPTNRHIVKAIDVIVENELPYLVMEYVDGGTLADRLTPTGTALPRKDALSFAYQICDGMAGASRLGEISHLDLKPSNVLIERKGRAKIADFGLSRSTGMFSVGKAFSGGGTCRYMAPEQYLREPVSPRCDIFAFGIIFYQMLTGRLPYPMQWTETRSGDMERLEFFHRMLRASELPDRPQAEANGIDYDKVAELSKHDNLRNVLASRATLELGAVGRIIGGCLGSYQSERQNDFGVVLRNLSPLLDSKSTNHGDEDSATDGAEWFRKGVSYQRLGEHQKAIECFNRQLIEDDRHAPSYRAAAASWRAIGGDKSAENLLMMAQQLEAEEDWEADPQTTDPRSRLKPWNTPRGSNR